MGIKNGIPIPCIFPQCHQRSKSSEGTQGGSVVNAFSPSHTPHSLEPERNERRADWRKGSARPSARARASDLGRGKGVLRETGWFPAAKLLQRLHVEPLIIGQRRGGRFRCECGSARCCLDPLGLPSECAEIETLDQRRCRARRGGGD